MAARQDGTSARQPRADAMLRSQDYSTAHRRQEPSKYVMLLPAVIVVLLISIFPLLASSYTSLSRIRFVRGGISIKYIGLQNYRKFLEGSEQRHVLGRLDQPSSVGWIVVVGLLCLLIYWLFRYLTGSHRRLFGFAMRVLTVVIGMGLVWLLVRSLSGRGLPGTLEVTLIFVFVGVTVQYLLGLMLALLVTQNLPGKRFFRVVFLLPMMITPVGIGFTFRMMMDTLQGPIAPLWDALGLYNFSWINNPSYARAAVVIGDTWQWTPFAFIILLAGLEALPTEIVEAAMVDGANRLKLFRYIILPQIIPVSTTVILIRLIESFKMIDMPNILTGGGPGTATETMTLQTYYLWRAIDLGGSSALAYLLLFVVTFVALVFVNFIRQSLLEAV
jgi:multiple sugar transport system permease protein